MLRLPQYLRKTPLLYYYKQINKAGSSEADVDAFYNNFLHQIFLLDDGFTIEQESRAGEALHIPRKTDFTIRYIKDGIMDGYLKKIILCENKRRDGQSQNAVWRDALDQVVAYARLIRKEPGQDPGQPLYLTVNVGTYLRFYLLPGRSDEAFDWQPAGGKLYELADDEEQVWQLWLLMRNQARQH